MKKLFIIFILFLSFNGFGQAPPFDDNMPEPTPATPSIPMDGGISAFLLAGIGAAIVLFYKKKK